MNELIVAEQINAVQLFDGKSVDPLLEQIKEKARSIVPDTTTASGRKEIASIAHSVARSKTLLDNAGKDLVSGIKAQAKIIDLERKKIRDTLDELKAEVREPLTKWEEDEARKEAEINERILVIQKAGDDRDEDGSDYPIEQLTQNLCWLKSVEIDESFGDHVLRASQTKDESIRRLERVIPELIKRAEQEAELERLKKEAEERAKAEREEQLRKEGEERAKREAEEKARAEAERVEREKKEKEEADRKERERAEAEKQAAIEAQREAERRAIAAEEKAKRDAIEAEALAKKRVEDAARIERERIAAEKRAEEEATKRREADKQHKAKINNAAAAALVAVGLDKNQAKMVIAAIATGKIPRVSISY